MMEEPFQSLLFKQDAYLAWLGFRFPSIRKLGSQSATMQSIKPFLVSPWHTDQQVGGRLGVKFSEVVHGVAQIP